MLNYTALIGRLTTDPKYYDSGTPRAEFVLAVPRTYVPKGKEKETDFIPVKVWSKTAELVDRYCHKGMQVAVEGSLQQRKWTGDDGKTKSSIEVNATAVHFLDSRTNKEQTAPDYSEIESDEDDLPF